MFKRFKEAAEERANDPDGVERRVIATLLKKQQVTAAEVASSVGCSKKAALRVLLKAEKAGKKNTSLPRISHRTEKGGDALFVVESGGLNRAQRRAMR